MTEIAAAEGIDLGQASKMMLGELIDLISGIALNEEGHASRDILGRVYEYFLGQFAGDPACARHHRVLDDR